MHLMPFWDRGHDWKLPIRSLSVKSEAAGILLILGRAGERLSEISFLKYLPLKPQRLVLHSTLHFFTWHSNWSDNGRQVKTWVQGKVALGSLFIEQLMSHKQSLNKRGLSHWGRHDSLNLGGSWTHTKLWSQSKKKVNVVERSKKRRSSSSCGEPLWKM